MENIEEINQQILSLTKTLAAQKEAQKKQKQEELRKKKDKRLYKKYSSFNDAVLSFSKKICANVLDTDEQSLNQSVLSKDGKEIVLALYSNFVVCKIYDSRIALEAAGISRCSEIDIFDPLQGIRYAYSRAKMALKSKLKDEPFNINETSGLFVS